MMTTYLLRTGGALFCAFLMLLPAQARQGDYVLGRGDLIRIQVYGEANLTLQTRIDENGQITYPFIGKLQLRGRTATQIERRIDNGLRGDYLVDPKVQVLVLEYRPFFINGEVNRPGGYPYVPGLTAIKAISIAGGFTGRADDDEFELTRENEPGRTYRARPNSAVYPGDTLTVTESLF